MDQPAVAPCARADSLRTVVHIVLTSICGLALGFTCFALVFTLLNHHVEGTRTYVVYWATGQQLAHHANPYDTQALARIEQAAHFNVQKTFYMRNPPWMLPFVYPLGWLGMRAGFGVWMLMMTLSLVLPVHLLSKLSGQPKSHRIFLAYSFAPVLICLLYGQTSLFALLGLVLFLSLHRSHPFLAGSSLWFCSLKPHLFLPFGVVLLAWIVVSKNYKVLAGAVTALAASIALTYMLDPLAWGQYMQMTHTADVEADFQPCLSFLLRVWIPPHSLWIRYLPVALASLWALGFYWSRRHRWDWLKDGHPLMLVSLLASPYYAMWDQVVAIPALLTAAFATRSKTLVLLLAFLSALIEICLLCVYWRPEAFDLWTLWSAPAWLAWYLYASSAAQRQ